MCGIAGVFRPNSSAEEDAATVRAMCDALARRGPDGSGLERDGPLTLGHRRLAILDLSDAGHQPMRSPSGRHVISFNGEIYNYAELRDELGVTRDSLRSNSDTEVLLLAWEKWGPAALDHLAGQWAFAMYDRLERRLWLARDRFGEKPLFYHRTPFALAFASSIAALLRVPWIGRTLDRRSLAEYLTLRYVVAPRTVVEDVHKIPGGHLLVADARGEVECRPWYRPRFHGGGGSSAHPSRRQREDLAEEFGALLVQASRRCSVSDVPVGILLSDGIDSNGVQAALSSVEGALPSFRYTMGDEASSIDGLVCGADDGTAPQAWEVRVSPRQRREHLVPAFTSFTEPVGDGASLATWLLLRQARTRATVFLCGHGADEVLGGYRLSQDRFRLAAIHYLAWLPAWSLRLLIDSKVFGAEPAWVRQRAMRRAPARRVPEAARYLIHKPMPPGELASLFQPREVPEPYLGVVDSLYGDCSDEATALDRIQEVMIRTFLGENILSFADSVAMDASTEMRMPFLDRDLVDFVFRLPPSMRVSPWPGRANTKRILRSWASRRMPASIVEKPKQGFSFGAVRELLRDDGDATRELVLGSRAVRDALPGLERWLRQPDESFRGMRGSRLWALLALSTWCESLGVR